MPRSNANQPLFTWPFLRLCLFANLAFLAAFQLFPTIPFHLIDLGISRARAGLFLTIYTWASALSAPFTGLIADRFGRRRMLIVAAVSFALFSVLYGLVKPLPLLLVIGCLHGFFWSGMLSASGAMIVEIIPAARRTEGIGYYGIAATAAIAVAPAIGLAVYRHGWLALMLELTAMAVVLVVMAVLIPREDTAAPLSAKQAAHAPFREAISWRVVASASGLFLVALPYGAITSYVALFAEERDLPPRSLFFTVFALTVLVTRVFLPRLADRWGKPELWLIAGLLLVPPGLVLLGLAHTHAMLVAAAIVFSTGFGSAYPTFMTWVLARTDPRYLAATFGSVLLAFDTAIGCGSLLVGPLGEAVGLGRAFLVLAGVSALAVPAFLLTRRLLPASHAVA